MQENQKINEEIRKFLDLNTKDAQNNNQISYYNNYDETCDKSNNFEQLLQTLRELKSCYENDKVKDTAVINNNLTNLIKAIVEERKDKEEEIKAKENILNDFKKQIEEKEKEIVRIKNNVKYDKMKVEEVNRIFKDQKERFTEYKSKYEQQTKTLESLKLINKELEVLREREKEKNEYLEKQMNVFGEFLKEKDTEICSLKKKVSEKEDEIKLMNKKIDEIQESKVKNEKILQEKENIINVLNGEMNVLLGKIKGKKQETEDMKEKASYYERLYKSVSKQNEYLNKELYKMINIKKEDMQNKFTGLNDEKYKYDVNNKECKFDKKDKSADLNGWKYKYDNKNKEYKFDTKNKEYKFDNKNASFSFDSFCIENEQNLNEKLQNLKIDTKNDDFSKKQRNYKKKIKKIKNLYENKKMENERKDDEIKASKNKIYDLANEIKTVRTENEKMGDNYKKITEKLFERIENLIENNKNLQEMVYELKKENIKMDDVKEKNNMDYTYTIKPENDNLRNTNFRNDIFYNYEHGYEFDRNTYKEKDSFQSVPDNIESTKFGSPLNAENLDEMRGLRKYIESEEVKNPFLLFGNEKYNDNNHINDTEIYKNEDKTKESDSSIKYKSPDEKKHIFDNQNNDSTTSSLKQMITRTEKLKDKFDDLETKLKTLKQTDKQETKEEMTYTPQKTKKDKHEKRHTLCFLMELIWKITPMYYDNEKY